jgi:hypothetical protein
MGRFVRYHTVIVTSNQYIYIYYLRAAQTALFLSYHTARDCWEILNGGGGATAVSESSLVVETVERPRILSDDGHKRCHERLYAVRDSRGTISHTYPQRYKGESPELQTETLSAAGALLIGL